MTRWQALRNDTGLRRAKAGSLHRYFILALLVGIPIGWIFGSSAEIHATVSVLMLASLIVWQPLVEELLFRGLLQGHLLKTKFGARKMAGVSLANLLTSTAFVLTHLVNHSLFWAIGVFFPSLLFGLFRDRSGSVWPPLLLHVIFNATFFAAAILSG